MFGFIGGIDNVVRVLLFLLSWGFFSSVQAANPFQMGRVEYFYDVKISQAVRKKQESLDWRESVIGVDGKVGDYHPPAPVLALLEDPTDENALAYLNWQKLKMDKILKATEAIERVTKKET